MSGPAAAQPRLTLTESIETIRFFISDGKRGRIAVEGEACTRCGCPAHHFEAPGMGRLFLTCRYCAAPLCVACKPDCARCG